MNKFHKSEILLNSNSFSNSFSIDGKAVKNYTGIIQVPSVKIISRDNIDYKLQVIRPCTATIGDEEVSLREGDIIKAHLDNTSFYVIECVRPNPVKRHRRTVSKRSVRLLCPELKAGTGEHILKPIYNVTHQRCKKWGVRSKWNGAFLKDFYGKRGSIEYGYLRVKPVNDDWQYLDRDL